MTVIAQQDDTTAAPTAFWGILELMGHRRLAGYISEFVFGGAALIRIDVPAAEGNGWSASQMYGSPAIYCITPTTEELARKVAVNDQPAPITQWDLPQAKRLPARGSSAPFDDDIDTDDDGDDEARQ